MSKLILLRHLKSQWNLENRFTGWVDVPLAKSSLAEAKAVSNKIFKKNRIDAIFSSPLFRNMDTVARILYHNKKYPIFVHLDKGKMRDWGKIVFRFLEKGEGFPVFISEALNERYYGDLQGLNKKETMEKYGKDKVRLWRRGYENRPPRGETLKETYQRAVPFYKKYIETDLRKGKNVLVVASHNSLRALMKHIEKISEKDIINLELPYGGLVEYEFNNLKLKDNFVKVIGQVD